MINKKYIWLIFAFMLAAQFYVPLKMIWSSEKTINKGQVYKFKTIPVDPTDPFRGKYIRLRYEIESFQYEMADSSFIKNGSEIYALLDNKNGFANILSLTSNIPTDTESYIKINVSSRANGKIKIDLPFDKFFMEESLAKPAENKVRELSRDSSNVAYAKISVLNGNGVLQDVMVNNQSIAELVRTSRIKGK